VVQPQLQALEGVAKAELLGNQTYAMRVWLDPDRMAALGVSGEDVARCWRPTTTSPASATCAATGAGGPVHHHGRQQVEDFRNLVIRGDGNALVRLRTSPRSSWAPRTTTRRPVQGHPGHLHRHRADAGRQPAHGRGAGARADAGLRAQFPEGLQAHIPYDASEFIEESIREVFKTLGEAVLIVLFVIFLSLGSLRAAVVPSVTVPLAIVGAAFLMLLMGFSINLLTLLALVLAIGLVVDDAIVVVENVHRHIEMGKPRLQAAIDAARELALPIVAMTTTLVAVYAPIGFMGGLVGSLFVEFAFTLAAAVLISGVVALTLSPMISARVLRPAGNRALRADRRALLRRPGAGLRGAAGWWIRYPSSTVLVALVVIASIGAMYSFSEKELAPTEDQSILFFMSTAPQTATVDYNKRYVTQVQRAFEQVPEYQESFILAGFGGDTSHHLRRLQDAAALRARARADGGEPQLQGMLGGIAGFDTVIFPRPSLPSPGNGIPVEFVLLSDAPIEELAGLADQMVGRAMQSGKFMFLQKDIKLTRPRTVIEVDRDLAGDLGISMRSSAVAGDHAEPGLRQLVQPGGRSYQVIPQVRQRRRNDMDAIRDYQIAYRRRRAGAPGHPGEHPPRGGAVQAGPVPAAQRRDPVRRHDGVPRRGPGVPGDHREGDRAAQRALRLQGRVASVQAGGRGAGSDLLPVHPGHLPGTGGAVRELARPFVILMSVPLSIAGAMAFLFLGFAS
jgi:multidrug efflux pump